MPLVRQGPGVVRGVARTAVVAGTASAVSGRVARRQQQRWAAEDSTADEQAPAAQPPPAAAAQSDYVAELEQLARLRDQGVIDAADFEAKKKQLLGI